LKVAPGESAKALTDAVPAAVLTTQAGGGDDDGDAVGVKDGDGDEDGVDDGDDPGEGVPDGVPDGEHEAATARPVVAQHGHGTGAADASGQ